MATKIVRVKAHDRLIRTRIYKFICDECLNQVERETYAVRCPKYCIDCRPPQPSKSVSVSKRTKVAEMIIRNLNRDDESNYSEADNNGNLEYAAHH